MSERRLVQRQIRSAHKSKIAEWPTLDCVRERSEALGLDYLLFGARQHPVLAGIPPER